MKIILTATLLMLLAIPAAAKTYSAKELADKCMTPATTGFCNGYIAGWAQTMNGTVVATNDGLFAATVNPNITVAAERDAFVKYMKVNTEFNDKPADLILLLATAKAGFAGLMKIETEPQVDRPKAAKPL